MYQLHEKPTWKRMMRTSLICLLMALLVGACIRPEPQDGQAGTSSSANGNATTDSVTTTQASQVTATESTTTTTAAETTETTAEITTTETTTANSASTESNAAASVPTIPPPTEEYNGVPVGFTAEGYPYRGKPDAPVTMYEFSDYQCPFCARYFVQTEPAMNESYVRTGKLRVVFRDFPLVSIHPYAHVAAEAANCVAEQGAARYWAMHDQLFRTQTEWSNSTDPLPVFKRLVEEVEGDVAQFTSCMDAGTHKARVDAGMAEAQQRGYGGTPSFRFVGTSAETSQGFDLIGAQPYDQFANYIDSLVAGTAPASAQQTQQGDSGDGGIPVWATADGLKPNPDRPGYTMAGDEYRGSTDASMVVIEFSDFQCPYCRRHVESTEAALVQQYVDTDKIMWVFKHFPLNIHPQAFAASIAAVCGAQQGKFWEMHDLLFKNVDTWSVESPNPVFSTLAQELSLDSEKFDACLTDKEVEQQVQNDLDEGARFIQGTPSFIVLRGGEGRIIPGALPIEDFTKTLDEILANGFQQQ